MVDEVRLDGPVRIEQAGTGFSEAGGSAFTQSHQDDHHHRTDGQREGPEPTESQPATKSSMSFPWEEDPSLDRSSPPHRGSYCTSWFIWINGMRIAMVMNPTAAPRHTISSGSSKLVRAATFTSTSAS